MFANASSIIVSQTPMGARGGGAMRVLPAQQFFLLPFEQVIQIFQD